MRKIFTWFLLCVSMFLFAQTKLSYDDFDYPIVGNNELIFSENFDQLDSAKLELKPGYSLVDGAGVNSSKALHYTRSNRNDYALFHLDLPMLEANHRYVVTFKARSEKVKNYGASTGPGPQGYCCVEFFNNPGAANKPGVRDGQWAGGEYYKMDAPPKEFKTYQFDFLQKAGTYTKVVLMMRRQSIGNVWWDDIEVRKAGTKLSTILTWPPNLTFKNNDGKFKLHADPEAPEKIAVQARLKYKNINEEKSLVVFGDENKDFSGDFGKLPVGSATLTLRLIDLEKKVCLAEDEHNVNILANVKAPKNAAQLDEYGRLIVDGKPFFVLGMFNRSDREIDYKIMSEAGFNTVLSYNSFDLRIERLNYEDFHYQDQVNNVRHMLNRINEAGMKFIFSFRHQLPGHLGVETWAGAKGKHAVSELAMEKLRNHPAMIGWYTADEDPRSNVPDLVHMRESANRIDPWRPTIAITNKPEYLPYFARGGDIICVDPYPIQWDKGENQNLDAVVSFMQGAQTAGLPIWATPQLFNWGWYRAKTEEEYLNSRKPNEKEIMAMPLLCTIMGAKGFIFFSYHDVMKRADLRKPGQSAEDWPKVKKMISTLKELEAFIMSTEEAPKIKVESKPEGKVYAGALKYQGKLRILIAGIGGEAEAIITVPDGIELESQFKNTKSLGNGRYLFRVSAIDSDILGN